MRKRMRKNGGADGRGSIKRGMNQRVHLKTMFLAID
jgi:hypothetical protein